MFSCDYATLVRLARIEARSISRTESSGDYLPIQDARDYALAVEAMRHEDAQKLQDFKDDTFHKVLQITGRMCRTHGLTEAKRAEIQLPLDALIDAIK